MLRKLSLKIFFMLCVLMSLSISAASAADKLDLKLNLQTGKAYKLRTESENTMKSSMNGQPFTTSQNMIMDMLFEVSDKTASGDHTLKATFERVKASISGPMGDVSYDSSMPGESDSNPMVAGFSALTGQSFSMTLSEHGQVLNSTGMKEIVSAMLDKLPSGNEQMRQSMRAQFEKMLGNEGMAGKMFGFLPKKPVATGESWSRTDSVDVMLKMKIDQTWTLDSLRGGVAVIDAKSTMTSDPDAPFTEMGPMKVKMNINGQQSGAMRVDANTGWIVGGAIIQQMSGEQVIKGGPAGDSEMRMPIEMEVKSTFGPY